MTTKHFGIILLFIILISSIPSFAFGDADKIPENKGNDADYYYNLGVSYQAKGKYKEAIDAYKQATIINPGYMPAYFGIGAAYEALNKHQEAIDAYNQAIRINP